MRHGVRPRSVRYERPARRTGNARARKDHARDWDSNLRRWRARPAPKPPSRTRSSSRMAAAVRLRLRELGRDEAQIESLTKTPVERFLAALHAEMSTVFVAARAARRGARRGQRLISGDQGSRDQDQRSRDSERVSGRLLSAASGPWRRMPDRSSRPVQGPVGTFSMPLTQVSGDVSEDTGRESSRPLYS